MNQILIVFGGRIRLKSMFPTVLGYIKSWSCKLNSSIDLFRIVYSQKVVGMFTPVDKVLQCICLPKTEFTQNGIDAFNIKNKRIFLKGCKLKSPK